MNCTHWQRITHLTSLHPTNTPCYSSQADQDPLTSSFNPPSSLLFLCPLSCAAIFYWCTSCINFVTHLALSLLSLSVSFFLSFCLSVFLSVWFFQSLITCLLFSTSSFLCFRHGFYVSSFQPVLSIFPMLMFSTSTQLNHALFLVTFFPPPCPLPIFIFTILTYSHTPQHVIVSPPHVTLSALIEHLLYNSSHPSHRSLNGLSPTTIFSLLPLLFPLPSLSISLGGPAFLPGFCRPRCEN